MINFTYLSQPPRRYTFEAPKVKEWTETWCKGKVLNLFAGKTILNVDEVRVDIDKNVIAHHCMDAYEFLKTWIIHVKDNKQEYDKFDTIILDPPWNYRKAREKYEGRWIGKLTKVKNLLPQILNDGGRVISWGYSTVGMSKSRGFKKVAICLVCNNGDHNDSMGLVEEKIKNG